MNHLARTIVTGAVCAVLGSGVTGWLVHTDGRARGRSLSLASLSALPPEGAPARVPLGDLAGAAKATMPGRLANPLESDPGAVVEGERLYKEMNCAGCHGYAAKGGMGPDLTDAHWRYGGTPVQIYKSIYEGRPKGMPAWGRALPQRSIWQLTRYIETLGGSFPTEAYHAGLQGDLADERGAGSSKSPAHGDSGEGAGGDK
ncbi:c-type cytochrome [Sphingomonas parva]|uniref:C-type cytochrome n=1 Tax=Sphingomonas parva TaxID=2555898 RepID=A0A4Y8ZNJ9_9SPHN|nr:c-type cytochrome [Sphingomonas parva]TFI57534.1 c-type cytochrome [Sphingomonas parva]